MDWGRISDFKRDRNFVSWIDAEGEVQMQNTLYGVLKEYIELKKLQSELNKHLQLIKDADVDWEEQNDG